MGSSRDQRSPADGAERRDASSLHVDPLEELYRSAIGDDADRGRAKRRALLCVDLQALDASRNQGIFEGRPASEQAYYFDRLEQVVLPNVQRLQRAFRAAGEEVIHVRIQSLTLDGRDRGPTHKRLGLLATPGSADARFLGPVAPRGDEIVLNKTSSGAFESTQLDYVLRNLGVEDLVIVGVYTNECVSTAARVASDLGFFVTVVSDACAAVAPRLHEHAITTLRDRYARILDTDRVVRETRERADDDGRPEPLRPPAPKRTIVLLGGGAFASNDGELTMAGQFDFADRALSSLGPLLDSGRELLIGHGNGPQVGHMLARVEASLGEAYRIPLSVCVAESEGELGYVLQQTLHNVLRAQGISRPVVSVLTQTLVDRREAEQIPPTKPIGPVYDADRAKELERSGFAMRECAKPDGSSGWRRIVRSPEPVEIVETGMLDPLLRTGAIVVAAGGGGVPVVRREDGSLEGIEAVVDKDLSGALLGIALGAEELIILTSVPCVYLDWESDAARPLSEATPELVSQLASEGHFEEGTMKPKVEAARRFAAAGGAALICDVDSLADALDGRAGTWIRPDD